MPTSYAAPPLSRVLTRADEAPPVWPDEEGEVRGYEFSPLYKSVPFAARRDPRLYELLALVDAIRGGALPEREAAIRELRVRLEKESSDNMVPVAAQQPDVGARAAGSRVAASKIKRGSNGQEAQRIYRRRHRDS
jgi:hypothetical protein